MYQLVVVSGRNRGTVYPVKEGENWLGRQDGNEVCLQSSRISKRHAVVILNSDGLLEVRDNGSANGTFVNGSQTRGRELQPGDRIGVGDFILQVVVPSRKKKRSAPPVVLDPNAPDRGVVVQGGFSRIDIGQQRSVMPAVAGNLALAPQLGSAPDMAPQRLAEARAPQFAADPKAWFLFYFEKLVMPIFYNLSLKQEWRGLSGAIIGTFVVLNLVVSVQPLLESGRESVVHEVMRRAQFMAREIADHNSPFLASKAETKTEIGAPENASGVRVAMLTDMDMRIIAPATKLNQYLTYGIEAQFVARMRDRFRTGQESGIVVELNDTTVAAVEPVMVLSTQAGKNVPVGMAVVSIDTTLSTASFGEMGVVYSETLILTGLLALVMALVLYRLTLKQFEVLGDDLDKALKGDLPQVTHEFKLGELDPLWDLINSAVQRIPKGAISDPLGVQAEPGIPMDDCVNAAKAFAALPGAAVVMCGADQKILFLNERFEELTGIRAEGAIGQEISSMARDQAFAALVSDLFERSAPGAESVVEEFEFSGTSYQVRSVALGSAAIGGTVKAYVLIASKTEAA